MMRDPRLDSLLARLAQTPPVWWGIWFGLLLITIGLLALMRTRWGQSQPLRKCVALSLLAHLLIACYATTVQIVHTTLGPPGPKAVRVSSVDLKEAGLSPAGRTASTGAGSALGEGAPGPVLGPDAERERLTSPTDDPVKAPDDAALPVVPTPVENAVTQPVEPTEILADVAEQPTQPIATVEPAAPLDEAPSAQRVDDTATSTPSIDSLPRPEPSAPDVQPRPGELNVPGTVGDSTPLSSPTTEPELPAATATADTDDLQHNRSASPAEPAETTTAQSNSAPAPLGPQPLEPGRATAPANADSLGQIAAGGSAGDAGASIGAAAAPSLLVPLRQQPGIDQVPEIYRGRVENAQGEHDAASGATAETEQAVRSALTWLVANQSADGRWDAQRFGAGTERRERGPKGLPQDRQGAGAKSDTGVTGLALLAFLGAGHTHLAGDYQESVRKGLDFLLRTQRADGNLGGDATVYSFMYCHGMAAFALSEAYGMTGDARLKQPVRKATAFTLAAQHPSTGGWRYRPGELGDMSQLGWQLMALKSASLAGVDVPQMALDRAAKFIRSVSFGTHGGLASYRPGEQASRTMTAEALASRQFLGLAGDNPTSREAADYVLGELPGGAPANLYYWYYASLAMHNMQGEYWEKWNEALRLELLATQDAGGPNAGSWPTDSIWAGYGGRVYTTAMGALCLEVYYRYLPIYLEASAKGNKLR